ncbi:MAG: peptide chain release factor 2 [Planctomycetia bacterium]|nr:MAG: peptide chain release factor 2 [Planctomycetia bacterium]RIK67397.1 MAG: peptide chain release factor 2 [Planctomycetota bacterium]
MPDGTATLEELTARITALRDSLDLPAKKKQLKEKEDLMSAPGFWDSGKAAQSTIAELKSLKAMIDPVEAISRRADDIAVLYELGKSENDAATLAEADQERLALAEELDRVALMALLSGPNDARDCYFSIQAGAGGTEACDWASMLFRMYLRYFERKGYKVEELDRKDGEEAGIQSVNLLIKGPYAYGYMSTEQGVHRLVRISPFNAQGKRQTSFAAVDVLPVFPESTIELPEKDLEITAFCRSSGAGGQNVNKVASAVRIKHIPTGIVAECVNERSQAQNKQQAMAMLISKLEALEEAKREGEMAKINAAKGDIAWGNQIRNYVLDDPRVKDLRTGIESGNPQKVLDGAIDEYIEAMLRLRAEKRAKEPVRAAGDKKP